MLKIRKSLLLCTSALLLVLFSSISLGLSPVVQTFKYKFDNNNPKYTIYIKYPQFRSTTKQVKDFNQYVINFVKEQVALFKKGVRKPVQNFSSSLNIDYKITYLKLPKWISIKFTRSTYFAGAAHPMAITLVLNYDFQTGKPLTLSQLFSTEKKYLANIASYSRKVLHTRKLGQYDFITQGAKSTLQNYHNWNITKEGLLISFDPYQVAAYAYGPQVVNVPLEIFAKYLKPEYLAIWQ